EVEPERRFIVLMLSLNCATRWCRHSARTAGGWAARVRRSLRDVNVPIRCTAPTRCTKGHIFVRHDSGCGAGARDAAWSCVWRMDQLRRQCRTNLAYVMRTLESEDHAEKIWRVAVETS